MHIEMYNTKIAPSINKYKPPTMELMQISLKYPKYVVRFHGYLEKDSICRSHLRSMDFELVARLT